MLLYVVAVVVWSDFSRPVYLYSCRQMLAPAFIQTFGQKCFLTKRTDLFGIIIIINYIFSFCKIKFFSKAIIHVKCIMLILLTYFKHQFKMF
jgi:hypothetical protein